jgi:hypothetical protein
LSDHLLRGLHSQSSNPTWDRERYRSPFRVTATLRFPHASLAPGFGSRGRPGRRRSSELGDGINGSWNLAPKQGGQCDSGGLAEHAPATSVRPRDSCFSVGSTRMTRPRPACDGFCLHGLLVSHSDTAGDEVGSRSKFPAHLTKTSTTAARLQNTHGPTFDRSEPPFNSWAPGTGWIGSGSSVSKIILEGVHVATFPDIFVFYTTILERKKNQTYRWSGLFRN